MGVRFIDLRAADAQGSIYPHFANPVEKPKVGGPKEMKNVSGP